MGSATQAWKKRGRILKVILYGSYARGDWVDDPKGGYRSDYDILVVVNDARLTDPVEYWATADDRLMRDATINQALSAPVNFIVHDLADVNDQLAHGRPFFVDIAEQGIALYQAEGFELTTPRVLPPEEARAEALRRFGDVDSVREHCRTIDDLSEQERSRADMWDALKQDLRYAVRALREARRSRSSLC